MWTNFENFPSTKLYIRINNAYSFAGYTKDKDSISVLDCHLYNEKSPYVLVSYCGNCNYYININDIFVHRFSNVNIQKLTTNLFAECTQKQVHKIYKSSQLGLDGHAYKGYMDILDNDREYHLWQLKENTNICSTTLYEGTIISFSRFYCNKHYEFSYRHVYEHTFTGIYDICTAFAYDIPKDKLKCISQTLNYLRFNGSYALSNKDNFVDKFFFIKKGVLTAKRGFNGLNTSFSGNKVITAQRCVFDSSLIAMYDNAHSTLKDARDLLGLLKDQQFNESVVVAGYIS